MKIYYVVQDVEFVTSTKMVAKACVDDCEDGCSTYFNGTWRSAYTPNLGANGVVTVSKSLIMGGIGNIVNGLAMQMNSVQKFLRSWQSKYMTNDITVFFTTYGSGHTDSDSCITLPFLSSDGVTPAYKIWQMGAHEAGHAYHFQLLGAMPYLYGETHYGHCSYNANLATFEGWANFVGVRSWYPDAQDTAKPIIPSLTKYYEIEPGRKNSWVLPLDNPQRNPEYSADCGTHVCDWDSTNIDTSCNCLMKNEMMATRAFWDIYDNRVDGEPRHTTWDSATTTMCWVDMAYIWTIFPPGTGNGQNNENDGMNMLDYKTNSASLSDDAYNDITLVYDELHSCMDHQPTN